MILDFLCGRHPGARGQALPLIAVGLIGLLGLGSLAVDLGYWRYEQRVQQTAADAAAMAGAITQNYSPSTVTASARSAAAQNGFTHDGVTTFVTVNVPPLSGNYTSTAGAVEVIVRMQHPAFFGGIFGVGSQWVTARAVAIPSSANSTCIYALDPVGPSVTLNVATVTMPHCGIMSNGALLFHQGSVDGAFIGYATPTANNTINGTAFPDAQPQQAVAAADPCPSLPGCAYLTAHPPTTGTCASTTTFGSGNITLSPGRYCSTVIFNNSTSVTFSPGVYDFDQGLISNNALAFSGNGVTFYINGNNWIFNGSPTINLVAPTSGNTAGVLMYQPVANTTQFHINSGSSPGTGVYAGTLYFPGTEMIIDGKYSSWTLAIADDILFNGGGTTSQAPGTGLSHVVLAE